jgi:hypothetical protein
LGDLPAIQTSRAVFRRYFAGKTLDEQQEILAAMDPARPEFSDRPGPLTANQFNAQRRRLIRAEVRWLGRKVIQRRRPCYCRACIRRACDRHGRIRSLPTFPGYYVRFGLSFECHLEKWEDDRERMRQSDPTLVEELEELEKGNRKCGARLVRVRDFAA